MAGKTKVLQISEGVAVTGPQQSFLTASSLDTYSSTANYISAKGSAAEEGDIFGNTTSNKINYYNGTEWIEIGEKNNFAASADPSATDDSASGYVVGSQWIDTTNDRSWICVDNTASAAVWLSTDNAKRNVTTTDPGVSDDDSANYSPGSLWVNTTDDRAWICLDASTGAAIWLQVGSGSGGGAIEDLYTQTFEDFDPADNSTGNNATAMSGAVSGHGGTTGTIATNTTNVLFGAQDLTHTQAAGSLNDYWFSEEISIGEGPQENYVGFIVWAKYTGGSAANGDYEWIIYDETNDVVLEQTTNPEVIATSKGTRYTIIAYVPDGVTSVRVGWQVKNENIGGILQWDQIRLTADPVCFTDKIDEQYHRISQAQSSMTDRTNEIEFNLGTATIEGEGSELITLEDDSGNTRTKWVANRRCQFDISAGGFSGAGGHRFSFLLNDATKAVGDEAINTGVFYSHTWKVILNEGDYVTVDAGGTMNASQSCVVSFVAQALEENIVAYTAKNTSDLEVVAAGNGGTALTGGTTDIDFTEVSDNFNAWDGNSFQPPETDWYIWEGTVFLTASTTGNIRLYEDGVFIKELGKFPNADLGQFTVVHEMEAGKSYSLRMSNSPTLSNSTTAHTLRIYKRGNGQLFGVPKDLVGYVDYTVTAGNSGGTATSGAWTQLPMNSTRGDFNLFGSLSSNVITLKPGVYDIDGYCTFHKTSSSATRLYDNDNSAQVIRGHRTFQPAGTEDSGESILKGTLTITVATAYEFQYRTNATKATDGLGVTAGWTDGDDLYRSIKITKRI